MVLLRLYILGLSTQALAFRGPAYRNGAASRRRPLRDAIAPLSSTERIDRCYAPDLVDEETSSRLAPEVGPFAWNTTARRVTIVVGAYLLYPEICQLFSAVPFPEGEEGSYFFELISVIFGTLTASTVSDGSERLRRLRAVAVKEATGMAMLLRQLEAHLLPRSQIGRRLASTAAPSESAAAARVELFEECVALLYKHSTLMISGTRQEELAMIAAREDYLGRVYDLAAGSRPELDFAVAPVEALIQNRACRLSLENSGIPDLQYSVLRVISVAIVLAFVYLTRPAAGFGYDVLHPRAEDVGLLLTSSFGARALFGYFCGALTVFYNLAVDFNKPFDGAFTLESGTLTATLRQMRDRVDVYIDT